MSVVPSHFKHDYEVASAYLPQGQVLGAHKFGFAASLVFSNPERHVTQDTPSVQVKHEAWHFFTIGAAVSK